MRKAIMQWLSTAKSLHHHLFSVTSKTPKHRGNALRAHLVAQGRKDRKSPTIVCATKVLESSITLDINGLVNTGMAIGKDVNGHLKLYQSSQAQNIQREGRAGRRYKSMVITLKHTDLDPWPETSYDMPKD